MDYSWLKHMLPLIAGAAGSALFMKYVMSASANEKPKRTAGAEVYTYTPKAKKALTSVGMISIAFALLPAVMIPYKYLGPEPCGTPGVKCRNKPTEDAIAGTLLVLGMSLGAYVCLIDPRKYYLKIDREGVTVNGLFSGLRSVRWEELSSLKEYRSSQLLGLKGKHKNGKQFTLFVPIAIGGTDMLMRELNNHGLFLPEVMQALQPMKDYLHSKGYIDVRPHEHFLPLLSVWKTGERYVAVLLGVTVEQKPVYDLHESSVGSEGIIREISEKLKAKAFPFDEEYQVVMNEDMEEIIKLISD